MDTIGSRIKHTRLARGMSVSDLARALDITPSGVSNWEHNKFNPRPEMLTQVAAALRIDRAYLETGEGEGPGETDHDAPEEGFVEIIEQTKLSLAKLLRLPVSRLTVQVSITS
ncbi:helix-turn-helix domain-containing protein [Methylobacterium frigidaeris]|uniref:HTH cro/C1-type domain-containing protein n=1 Tax=Methylobacterium frigidaeris TaxID=2038277 RepID=A0AA37M7Q3_9HYPH|nr:helix-turn-helix transcriptional regulator [Methylobacterium frigidaeris]PIK71278.1 hypothetical protein CS379_20190 [Methylobacterium frigidaeris]GJD66248.1 hypothetical protein MPEAHAMD_6445 [Methylobacterium frigidaeris]